MFGLLQRKLRQRFTGPDRPAPDQWAVDLLAEAGRLPAAQKVELRRQVSALWSAFDARFGGLHGYLLASPEDQQAYRGQLAEFVDRFKGLQGTDRGHAVVSAALMLQYTALIGRSDLSAAERRLSAVVAEMISAVPGAAGPARAE